MPIVVESFADPHYLLSGRRFVEMSFATYWDHIHASRQADTPLQYNQNITGVSLRHPLARLRTDIGFPLGAPFFVREDAFNSSVLFCGVDSITQAHYHHTEHAVLCQVVGTKRVLMFCPDDTRFLYPRHPLKRRFNRTRVQFDRTGAALNAQRFPAFASARVVDVTLAPGQMLVIPIFWWHAVIGQGFTVSVTHFWQAPWHQRFLTCRALRRPWFNHEDLRP